MLSKKGRGPWWLPYVDVLAVPKRRGAWGAYWLWILDVVVEIVVSVIDVVVIEVGVGVVCGIVLCPAL